MTRPHVYDYGNLLGSIFLLKRRNYYFRQGYLRKFISIAISCDLAIEDFQLRCEAARPPETAERARILFGTPNRSGHRSGKSR